MVKFQEAPFQKPVQYQKFFLGGSPAGWAATDTLHNLKAGGRHSLRAELETAAIIRTL